MKFETKCSGKSGKAYFALEFLREAYKAKRLNEIENMDYVLDCLDISSDLECAQQQLQQNNINY